MGTTNSTDPNAGVPAYDVRVENHGSIIMFYLCTDDATNWVDENLVIESWQWLGSGFGVDPRMAEGVLDRMEADGLTTNRVLFPL